PPLWGRGGEGVARRPRRCHIAPPPPLTPPHKGEGNAPSVFLWCTSTSQGCGAVTSNMARQTQRGSNKSLLRVAGLPAVSALFAAAPARVERLFFDQRLKPHVAAFCAELARARKPYRLVEADEFERVAGSVMHGGIVALALPKPVPLLDPAQAETVAP